VAEVVAPVEVVELVELVELVEPVEPAAVAVQELEPFPKEKKRTSNEWPWVLTGKTEAHKVGQHIY